MKTVPDDYSVEGLEASNHSDPGGLNEAVDYTTPNGTKFALAKDFLGIQFCMNGSSYRRAQQYVGQLNARITLSQDSSAFSANC